MLIKLDKQLKVIVMIALSLVAPPGWADTLYKSVGPDGKVIYSDKPPSDGQIEKIVEYAPDPSSPLPDYVPRFKPELEKRLQQQENWRKRGPSLRFPLSQRLFIIGNYA